jgi:RNA polymerase sigma factor, sigma-70 family
MVQKYQSLVYTVCHQLVPDAGDAQDLTHETFLAAWRAIDRCPSGFEKQWLVRIAANKAKDYLRSAWVRRVNIPGDDVLALEGAPPGTQPEQQVLDALGEEELTAMILDLREPYRTPCRLVLAGTAHHGRGGTAVRQTAQDGGSTDLPGKKDAGTAEYYSVKTMDKSAYMELFDKNG